MSTPSGPSRLIASVDPLVDLGERELADRALGTRDAGLAVLARADVGEAQHLGLDPELRRPRRARPGRAGRSGRLAPDAASARRSGRTRGRATAPPIVTRSFMSVVIDTRQPSPTSPIAIGVGHAHVGQVHLVELGLAGDLAQRPHLDAGRVHVEREVGEAAVLRDVGVGAGHEHPAVGHVGERVPHLLAVDDPLVAVAHGTGRERREVAAGAGLAEQLAPDLLAGEQRAEQPGLRVRARVARRSSARRGRGRSRSSRSRRTGRPRRGAAPRRRAGAPRSAPRPPKPAGKCTHASPRSYCAPRNARRSAGSCSAMSWSVRASDRDRRPWAARLGRGTAVPRSAVRASVRSIGCSIRRCAAPDLGRAPSPAPRRAPSPPAPSADCSRSAGAAVVAVGAVAAVAVRRRRDATAASAAPARRRTIDHDHDCAARDPRAAVQPGGRGSRTRSPGPRNWRLTNDGAASRHRGVPQRDERAARRDRHAVRDHGRAVVHHRGLPDGVVPGHSAPGWSGRRRPSRAGSRRRPTLISDDEHLRSALGSVDLVRRSPRSGRTARTS